MLKLTVSQDGSGDFASISEAVLAVPYELEAEICIGPGIYRLDILALGEGTDYSTVFEIHFHGLFSQQFIHNFAISGIDNGFVRCKAIGGNLRPSNFLVCIIDPQLGLFN